MIFVIAKIDDDEYISSLGRLSYYSGTFDKSSVLNVEACQLIENS